MTTHFRPNLKTYVVAGAAAGAVTVTGIVVGDEIQSVVAHQVSASVGIDSVADLTSEFSITAADTIDNTGGTSSANGFLVIQVWKFDIRGQGFLRT